MKRMGSNLDDDSDCDIWNYKSHNHYKAKKTKLPVSRNRLVSTAPVSKAETTLALHASGTVTVDRCPSCQAPFHLIAEALRLQHVHSCLETISGVDTECLEKEFCSSNNIKHYSLYRHDGIAKVHAGLQFEDGVSCMANSSCGATESVTESLLFRAKVEGSNSIPAFPSLDIADRLTDHSRDICTVPIDSSIDSGCAFDKIDTRDNINVSHYCEASFTESASIKDEYSVDGFASSEDLHNAILSPAVITEFQREFFEDCGSNSEAGTALVASCSMQEQSLERPGAAARTMYGQLAHQNMRMKNSQGCPPSANQRSIRSFFTSTNPLDSSKLYTNSDSTDYSSKKCILVPPKSTISRLMSAVVGGAAKLCGQVYNSRGADDFNGKHSTVSKVEKLAANTSSAQSSVSSAIANGDSSVADSQGKYGARQCPFYKRIPSTSFTVDAFSYGTIPSCTAYFLSHFHYDHYCGLTRTFKHTIYCSQVTANLLLLKIRVSPSCVKALPVGVPQMIEGVEVTLLDANHCPGSVMFLFKLKLDGREEVYLHTGDFRADQSLQHYPQLQSLHVNQLFLDTTYCNPSYAFPPQQDVIEFAVHTTKEFLKVHPKALIVAGTYTIGKERIFTAIAEALNCKICVTLEKKRILDCLEDNNLSHRLTGCKQEARVHVVGMKQLNIEYLTAYLNPLRPKFDHVLAFEPTGWTHSNKTPSIDNIRPRVCNSQLTIYGVPYSEHSSYEELKQFVQFLRPQKIIPTVNNGDARSRQKMSELFNAWQSSPVIKGPISRQSALVEWIK